MIPQTYTPIGSDSTRSGSTFALSVLYSRMPRLYTKVPALQERATTRRCIPVGLLPANRVEQLALAAIACMVVVSAGLTGPAVLARLQPAASAPAPPVASPPPAAVILPDERDADLASVVTLVNDSTFGTAFFIDGQGDLLTAAHLVSGSSALRIVDNTGGSQVVRVLGVDAQLDVAELRVQLAGPPLPLGDPETVQAGDSLVLLASPKNASLPLTTTGLVTATDQTMLRFQADIRPGNIGGHGYDESFRRHLFLRRERELRPEIPLPDVRSP